jgi:hypothetical protein
MTKTEISGEVFNQHAPSFEIDEALRLLHGIADILVRFDHVASQLNNNVHSNGNTKTLR